MPSRTAAAVEEEEEEKEEEEAHRLEIRATEKRKRQAVLTTALPSEKRGADLPFLKRRKSEKKRETSTAAVTRVTYTSSAS